MGYAAVLSQHKFWGHIPSNKKEITPSAVCQFSFSIYKHHIEVTFKIKVQPPHESLIIKFAVVSFQTKLITQLMPDSTLHTATAWLLVHHLGLDLAVFDIIAWNFELIHRKGSDLWADWRKQAHRKAGSRPGMRALCQIQTCLKRS